MIHKTIAILDDEPDILELVAINLMKNGFEPITFEYVDEFWDYLYKCSEIPPTPLKKGGNSVGITKGGNPALIVLDLMLNDANGFDVCRQLRADERYAHIPIIMLTARSEETEKIVGLEIGADDYVTKPFSPRELVARIKAILKRVETQYNASQNDNKIIVINQILEIDLSKYTVKLEGKTLDLTQTEFKLLKLFAERKGWVFSRDQLLDYLWGNDKIVIDRTIDVHIKNLREKLGQCGGLIKNVRGVGYKLDDSPPFSDG